MKVALVTGASRGIGAATAELLAERGYAVVVNYRVSRERAEKVAADIAASGGKAIAIQADMGIEADIVRLFASVEKQLGPVEALVNNAAITPSGPVEETTSETFEKILQVNVLGVSIACREAVKHMRKTGSGAIVNVSSEAARSGGNKVTYYAASKAAVNTFTAGFAREVTQYNIRVNVVSPGVIDTDAHRSASPERLNALKASLPMGRMGKPEEVAKTIAWLLSEDASYVSGGIISVTGAR